MGAIEAVAQEATPRIMVGGLGRVGESYSLRCDAKQSENRYLRFDAWISSVPHYWLNEVLPTPIVKGAQPTYSEDSDAPFTVITTMAIQNLSVELTGCRRATTVDFGPDEVRKPHADDVLLTVDGGTSIGKPVLFDLEGDFAVDSHVAILRPVGLPAILLVHLLASPLGQLQFERAESGSSGQTAVTEDDLRRFRFPSLSREVEDRAIADVSKARKEARKLREAALSREAAGWETFLRDCAPELKLK